MHKDLVQSLKDRLINYNCHKCGTQYELGEARLTNDDNRIEGMIFCRTCQKASPATFIAQE